VPETERTRECATEPYFNLVSSEVVVAALSSSPKYVKEMKNPALTNILILILISSTAQQLLLAQDNAPNPDAWIHQFGEFGPTANPVEV
jgi:hypothetical protein